ncbi:MAG TPA: M14 family metallopeptidase [Xanthomonadaceae bacterium]|nr:M14 family metallopeptidase [Xanthomonadaceae bacterium]
MARLSRACLALALASVLGSAFAATPAPDGLATVAERSGFRETGRYDEVIALCDAFQQRYPKAVRCFDFGTTPEGRPMKAMAVSTRGLLTPEAARAANQPVVLVQGGIHAGEIDGKDAGFLVLRELLARDPGKLLDRQVLLFVPVFNVDGHERFGAWNRPNQRGPEQMGWRVTAQNLNLNRDYVKADAPEMRAMLALVNAWDPLACVDLHVTDGAKFQHDVSVEVEPATAGDAQLRTAGRALRDGVIARLDRQGSMALPFYPSFVEADDPASGFEDGVAPPRFSNGYFQLRNRFGMLVETHSWKDYPTRVRITRNAILAVLDQVAGHGAQWLQAAHAADERATRLGGSDVPLDWKATGKVRTIAFQGYAYTRSPSDVSGALMTHYDETRPQVWHVPLRDELVPDHVATAPLGGYLVPAAEAAWVADKLRAHGVAFRRVDAPLPDLAVDAYRAAAAQFAPQSFEGHQRLATTGAWGAERESFAAGALFVPIAQPKARLAMALLEPQAPDSLLHWGGFNNFFEQKEYMEAYVAEDVARDMLAKDPALKAAFERKLHEDPEFAADPQARLDFFYRRHPSWDQRFRRYPVVRVARSPMPE